ncbi:alkanesulfonate monooxygenase [Paenibacillus sp. A3]|uniref:alkanesulfonate monooxygenase n=1 Tax=Paenibacillus sp. A3 TaxID=1337054 RepID=UPI0006D52D24|nr:alkanesulfonate monooxygenase [Paenibacillus sp. A3]KPV57595.1 alkanesulfonate monooxygenase [Paenibacillus sp. A3]
MELYWWLPTQGDGRFIGTKHGMRDINLNYLGQVARAVELLGFDGALVPTGRSCEDPWVISSALLSMTDKMKFLIAIRPGVLSPTVAARMSATFDRISRGRLLLNVVTGGVPSELAGDGLHLDHDQRYKVTEEFLAIWRQLMSNEQVDYQGEYLNVKNAKVLFPAEQKPYPPIFLGGSSEAAQKVAAKHADVYITWAEPPKLVEERIKRVRNLAEKEGRTVKFGIRFQIIVRETEEEARLAAKELIQHVRLEDINAINIIKNTYDSEGQRRQTELVNSSDDLWVYPNLWTGIGLVRSGAGLAIVGNPDQVAERLIEYRSIGIDSFVLSGYPHLEEAYRVAELVIPKLKEFDIGEKSCKESVHGKVIAWF